MKRHKSIYKDINGKQICEGNMVRHIVPILSGYEDFDGNFIDTTTYSAAS